MEKSKSVPREWSSATGSSDHSGFSADQTRLLVRTATPGRVVSLSTCSKVCAVSFAVGVFVGFTINRRFRRWVSKLLRRLRDD